MSPLAAALAGAAGAVHDGPVVDRANGFDIVDCRACGFRHAAPLPPARSLDAIYRDEYYRDEKPAYLKHASEDREWAELAHGDRLASIARILENFEEPWRLLDIGSGPGFFLKSAGEFGFDALGVEPSAQAAAHARKMGLNVVQAFFGAEVAARLGRFHAVHMNHVLEHVPDPIAVLAAANAALEPGGALCVCVPNDYNPFQRALREADGYRPWWLAPPHHLNYFGHASLARLVERMGFEVVERTTSFPMELFLLMGDNYVETPSLGRACHLKRKHFDLTLALGGQNAVRRAFYRALGEAGLGRDAIVVARKR